MGTMKLCLLSPEFYPVTGGVGAYTVELVKNLPKDIEIHIITVNRYLKGNPNKLMVEAGFTDNVNTVYMSDGIDNFLYYFDFQLACLQQLEKLHQEFKFDILHTQFPLMPDIFLQLFKKINVPNVCTIHSTIETQLTSIKLSGSKFSELDRAEKANVLLFYPLKICEFFYLKKMHRFLTVSEFIKRELLNSFKFLDEERMDTIYHGVDTKFFNPNKEDSFVENNGPIILFTGRFVAKKGPHILIRAMPKILKSVPDACFVFVGSGDFTPYLRIIKNYKIPENNFKLLGYVAGSELPKIYNSATLYVAPSFEDSLGIRILEAMSCEKAVVASNVGGVPEIINDGKNGFLVSPGDVNKLAEKIIMLLEDENLRKKIAIASRRTVLEKFSVVRMANQTARLYNEILNNN